MPYFYRNILRFLHRLKSKLGLKNMDLWDINVVAYQEYFIIALKTGADNWLWIKEWILIASSLRESSRLFCKISMAFCIFLIKFFICRKKYASHGWQNRMQCGGIIYTKLHYCVAWYKFKKRSIYCCDRRLKH